MASYRTAFLGFPDASQYVLAAATNIFHDAQRPAGYPFLLRLIHHLSDNLSFTLVVQHAMGVAAGLLLYDAVRRSGGPPWLGLLPAAIAFFGGTGLFLEHSLLGDAPFAFLQVLAVYLAIRALHEPRWRWPVLAGLVIGVAFWIKTAAVAAAIVIALAMLLAAPGGIRRRLVSALAVAAISGGMVLFYVGAQYYFTGYLGYERQSAWDLYGRVATFVDCSKFTPPAGTRFLCPRQPLGHRLSQDYYQYGTDAPAPARYGPPYAAPAGANAVLERFSVAAVEHEPLAYAKAIVHGLGVYLFPRDGEGYTPQAMREAVAGGAFAQASQPIIALFYPHSPSYDPAGTLHPLSTYESHTRVEGPLLILLLLAALLGPLALPTRMRWAAFTFTLTAVASITFAVAGNGYDARYAYPTFGLLAAGAALGAWGVWTHAARALRQRRRARANR